MGRAKRDVPSGKVRIRCPKKGADSTKRYALYYVYSINGELVRKNTGIYALISDWNDKANGGRGELRQSFGDDYARNNSIFSSTLNRVDSYLVEYAAKHPGQITVEVVHSILFDEPLTRSDEGQDFVEFVLKDLKLRYSANKIKHSRYENGVSGMNIFQEFLRAKGKGTYKEDSIYLGEISGQLIDNYIDYRRSVKKNSVATINHSLTPIFYACERAKNQGFITPMLCAEVKERRLIEDAISVDDTGFDGKYLTKEDLKKLLDFYNADNEVRRKEYIEMFLFAFHAGGLRIIDVMTLQWKHIDFKKREIKKVLIKTVKTMKQRHVVPLTEPALRILMKWQKMERRKNFVFDLLPTDDFDITNQEALYSARNSVDKKVNQALRIVGEKMKLPFRLTFHSARHSFAINALNDEEHPLDMYQVSRLLGHSSTEVTEKVYADYVTSTLRDKVEALNFDFVPDLEMGGN